MSARLETDELRAHVAALPIEIRTKLKPIADPFCGVCLALLDVETTAAGAALKAWHDHGTDIGTGLVNYLIDCGVQLFPDELDGFQDRLNQLVGGMAHARCELIYALSREAAA